MNNKPLVSISIASALLLSACSNQQTVTTNVGASEKGSVAGQQQTHNEQTVAATNTYQTPTQDNGQVYDEQTVADGNTYHPTEISPQPPVDVAAAPAPNIPHYPAQPIQRQATQNTKTPKIPHWPEHLNQSKKAARKKIPHYSQPGANTHSATHIASVQNISAPGKTRRNIPHYGGEQRPTFKHKKTAAPRHYASAKRKASRLPTYGATTTSTPPPPVRVAMRTYHQRSIPTHQRTIPTYKRSVPTPPTYHSAVTNVITRRVQPHTALPPRTSIAELGADEIRTIGDRIFVNESGGDVDKLVHWNDGENFASMGIGHFTWYPQGRRVRFGNTFPGLLDHLQKNGVQLPAWVQHAKRNGAPWRTRQELAQAKRSGQVGQLQNLLYQTRYIQAQYIFNRAKRAMPRLVKKSPAHLRPLVAQNLNAVANSKGGWYALIDYVNFKGEGLSRNGGYRGQNWGLLQVLENMQPSQPGPQAMQNFADSATQILQRRVNNSDPKRNEARWMRGWTVRINTYRPNFV